MSHMPAYVAAASPDFFFPRVAGQTQLRDAILDAVDDDGVLGRVNLPYASVELTGPLLDPDGRNLFHQLYGGSICGQGARGTLLVWAGEPNVPMITLNRCQRITLQGFSVRCDEPLLAGIRIQQSIVADNTGKAFSGLTSSLNEFRDITFQGLGRLGVAFDLHLVDPFNGNDNKNDHMKFEGCQVTGARWSAFVLEGRNAKAIMIRDCWVSGTFSGAQILNYGIVTIANYKPTTLQTDGTILVADIGDPSINGGAPVFAHGASFVMDGRQLSGIAAALTGTDYETGWAVIIGDRNEATIIRNLYGEKDQSLLYVPRFPDGVGGEAAAYSWLIENWKWVTNAAYPPQRGLLVDANNGSGTIRQSEHGQRVDGQGVAYKFSTPVGGPGVYSFSGNDIANDADGNVFVDEAPSNTDYVNTNRGYRDGTLARLGTGIVVPTDGPASRAYPRSLGQWSALGLPAPTSQWAFNDASSTVAAWPASTAVVAGDYYSNDGGKIYRVRADGTTASSGGPTGTVNGQTDGTATWDYFGTGSGVVRDLLGGHDMLLVGSVEVSQTRTGFATQRFVHLAEGTESAQANYSGFAPATAAVTWVFDFEIVASGGNRKLLQVGSTNTTVGGHGLVVIITSAGLLQINIDGDTTAEGSTNYEADGTVHRAVVHVDPAGNGVIFVATDAEKVTGTYVSGLTSTATKGFGAASAQAPDCYVGGEPAVFEGSAAITAASTDSRTLLGVNAS